MELNGEDYGKIGIDEVYNKDKIWVIVFFRVFSKYEKFFRILIGGR